MRERWKIWCEVSGGVTGFRAGFLKANGREVIYTNEDDAIREASRLNTAMNDRPYRTADFKYTVLGYGGKYAL
jgi:hypothetical protein